MNDTKNIFEFTEVGDDMTGIRITEGKYKGLHWTFGTVSFDEEQDEDGNLACHFDYIMHDNPNNLEENQEMLNFMGDVLVDVLDEELGEDNENHIDSIDIPLPPAGLAKEMVDNKAILDYLRENPDAMEEFVQTVKEELEEEMTDD